MLSACAAPRVCRLQRRRVHELRLRLLLVLAPAAGRRGVVWHGVRPAPAVRSAARPRISSRPAAERRGGAAGRGRVRRPGGASVRPPVQCVGHGPFGAGTGLGLRAGVPGCGVSSGGPDGLQVGG